MTNRTFFPFVGPILSALPADSRDSWAYFLVFTPLLACFFRFGLFALAGDGQSAYHLEVTQICQPSPSAARPWLVRVSWV